MRFSVVATFVAALVAPLKGISGGVVKRPADVFAENLFMKYLMTEGEQRKRVLQGSTALPIVEIVAQVFVLQDLEAYIVAALLTSVLSGNGPYTFFPPWDNAWDDLGADLISKFRDSSRQWRGHLRNLLEYHVFFGDLPPSVLGATQTLTMANGEEMTLTFTGSRIRANGVLAIATYDATDGYAYMLDDVLRPAWIDRNLVELASTALPTLASLVEIAGLADTLSDPDGTYTVFAPSEAAWNNLGEAILNYLRSPAGNEALTGTLLYHVVGTILPSLIIPQGGSIQTAVSGSELNIVVGDPVVVRGVQNDVVVVTPDVYANNGVVHIIDNVLLSVSFLPSVLQTVTSRAELSDLASAVVAAGLDDDLNEGGPLMLFAPTNTALGFIDSALSSLLLSDPGWILHLQNFLLYHVTTRVVLTTDFGSEETFTMLNGEEVFVRDLDNGNFELTDSFRFQCTFGTERDLQSLNGIVSTITRPLAPSWSRVGLFNIIDTDNRLSTLASLLESVDLAVPALVQGANWMIFAPTNQAFQALGTDTLNILQGNPQLLTDTLRNHIVLGIQPSTIIPEGVSSVSSLFGASLGIFKEGGDVFVNTHQVIAPDLLAYNGIVHIIDGVLETATQPTVAGLLSGTNPTISASTFFSELQQFGLDGMLAGSAGPFTVIVPTNNALQQFAISMAGRGVTNFFTSPDWVLHLKNFIDLHIAEGRNPVGNLSGAITITMMNGEEVTLSNTGTVTISPTVPGSTTPTRTDVAALNGVVHVMPLALKPAFFDISLTDVVQSETNILSELVVSASLDSALTSGAYTIFAPNDDAFLLLGEFLDDLRNPANEGLLRLVLQYHVSSSIVPSTGLGLGESTTIDTLAGEDLSIQKTSNGAVLVDGAAVVDADRLANNGIVHVINAVLEPPNLTSTPTQAPIALPPGDRIDDVIRNLPLLSTLESVLDTAGLLDDLGTYGPFVVFTPRNVAFSNMPAGVLSRYSQPQYIAHLINLLNYHIYVGSPPQGSVSLTMRNGETAQLNGQRIEGILVIATNNNPVNGQMRLIDSVLLPSWLENTVTSIARTQYSTLFGLVESASLTGLLTNRNSELTVFAPTNSAFAGLGDLLQVVSNDPDRVELILGYHILRKVLPTRLITGTSQETTYGGDSITIIRRDTSITVEGIPIVRRDQLVANGVIHGINAVLMPPSFMSTVSIGESASEPESDEPESDEPELTVAQVTDKDLASGSKPYVRDMIFCLGAASLLSIELFF